MNTIAEGWQEYRDRSARTSDIARQLAFAGIALLWVLSGGASAGEKAVHLPGPLHAPALLLLASLAFDLLQQIYGVVAIRFIVGRAERRGAKGYEFPRRYPWPLETLFGAKIVALIVAYAWLGLTVSRQWL